MAAEPAAFCESGLMFPPERWHNHASCLVELGNGDLLACWYHGSGERTADDVLVEGARRRAGERQWGKRFPMADAPGYPDCNPCIFLDGKDRLWLIYVTILANEWHTAILKYRVSSSYRGPGAPRWQLGDVLHVTPGEEFVSAVAAACDADEARLRQTNAWSERAAEYLAARREHARDKLYRRMGWMPRAHPVVLKDGRIILPLYSDGFDFSLMALSGDDGATWHVSRPLVSLGGVQPSVVERRDGVLVAYMRDNGPPPNRVMRAESRDQGETWSDPEDTDIPNPGSGLEVIALRSGHWLMVCNDTESGRHRLAVLLSEDEGKTWKYRRYLENDPEGDGAGSYSYPSVVQSKDETLYVTYSYHVQSGETIKWAHFSEAWVR